MEFSLIVSLIVFCLVYVIILIRTINGVRVPIWAAMLTGAMLILIFGVISPAKAVTAINFDVIIFLIGMFLLVSGLESSGTLDYVTNRILAKAKTPNQVLFIIIFIMGLLSAFLINDTIALVGTPIVIGLIRKMNLRPAPLLLSLAFGITIGSIMTPMGNPQNLLISLHSGMKYPMFTFLRYLALPTIANLIATYFVIKYYYRKEFLKSTMPSVAKDILQEKKSMIISSALVVITVLGFFVLSMIKMFVEIELNYSHIALMGGAAMLAFGSKKKEIIRGLNWQILVFFVAMFVFVSGLQSSGVIDLFHNLFPLKPTGADKLSSFGIIGISLTLSQFISNVPFVAIYLPIMHNYGFTGSDSLPLILLASASTIAGNLTIFGAASNIIILQVAEKSKVLVFSAKEFFKIGAIVTAVNIVVLIFFLVLI
mgnify:FL=1